MGWNVERTGSNALRVNVNVEPTKKGDWEWWVLLRSDAHHDNPKCRRDLELHHLNQCLDRNAGWIDNGDLFCAMQGKDDRRSNKSAIRSVHLDDAYFDKLVEEACEFYSPFAGSCITLGTGNHETGVLKHHEFNITERLASALRIKTGHTVITTGYTGWVRFRFTVFKTRQQSIDLWRTHGYGGGGPVTEDMIQRQRQLTYVDADIMLSGHTHHKWQWSGKKMYLSRNGEIRTKDVRYAKLPTYKDEYGDGRGGFHVERGGNPRPLGAWWLRFYLAPDAFSKKAKGKEDRKMIKFQLIEADT